jgi:SagB-type dehydrogenase family enzyme
VAERTTGKYGTRAERYVQLEAGHAAQNCSLQAVALGLGTVIVAAFDDARVKEALDLEEGEWPLCLLPVGRAQS